MDGQVKFNICIIFKKENAMHMMALDAKTGKLLMTNSGSLSEKSFRSTVLSSFPNLSDDGLIVIVDGHASRGPGDKRPPYKSSSKDKVVVKGSFTDHGGYALLNREVALGLRRHGFQVKAEVLPTGVQVDPMTHNMIRAMETINFQGMSSCPMIVGFTPMSIKRTGRRVIFYTMMETQGLHPEFVQRCNSSATEVWVPCGFYADVFKKAGVVRPIHVIPLGVNHLMFTPEAEEPALRYEEMPSGRLVEELPQGKRFMSLFGWSYRKGADVLCRSFLREFDGSEDAHLVIYSRYMGSSAEVHKEHVREEIRGYYREAGKDNPPRIFYCGDNIQASDLPGCYATADAFVFCSRGEGFGLILVEAGACGTPVISARNTAMTEFLDDSVAFCVENGQVAPANEKLCWISEYYRDQEFAVFDDQSIADFGRGMREVYLEKAEPRDRALNFRERILEKYTWDRCVMEVARRLRQR